MSNPEEKKYVTKCEKCEMVLIRVIDGKQEQLQVYWTIQMIRWPFSQNGDTGRTIKLKLCDKCKNELTCEREEMDLAT